MREVIILGTGPAGLTAALYTARANLKPLVIEGGQPGGQLTLTSEVENFPGFPEGILGPELMENMRRQSERFGAEIIWGQVEKVDLKNRPFTVYLDDGRELKCKVLIIATGASAKMLGIPGEKEMLGRGVSTCATCDGAFFPGKKLLVIGGGDTAMEEANFLTRFAREVVIVHRRDEFRASKIMQDRARDNPKIRFILNTVVEKVLGSESGRVTGALLKNVETGETFAEPCDGFFVAIGHTPNTGFVEGQLELEGGYIKTTPGTTRTNVPGVFACGDVIDHHYRQAITAAGMGCMAAMDAEKFLEGTVFHDWAHLAADD